MKLQLKLSLRFTYVEIVRPLGAKEVLQPRKNLMMFMNFQQAWFWVTDSAGGTIATEFSYFSMCTNQLFLGWYLEPIRHPILIAIRSLLYALVETFPLNRKLKSLYILLSSLSLSSITIIHAFSQQSGVSFVCLFWSNAC